MKEMWYSSNRFEKSLCCHKLADFIDATLPYPEAETGISSSMEISVCLSWQWHQSALWWARILRPCLDWVGVNTALASNVFMCTLEHRGDSWDVRLCSLYHDQCEMNRVRGAGDVQLRKQEKRWIQDNDRKQTARRNPLLNWHRSRRLEKAHCLVLMSNCLQSQITGFDMTPIWIATCSVDVITTFDDTEATVWPMYRNQYVTVSGYFQTHRFKALDHCPLQTLAHTPCHWSWTLAHSQMTTCSLSSVSGTSGLWRQDCRHSLSCSSLPNHPIIFYKLPTADSRPIKTREIMYLTSNFTHTTHLCPLNNRSQWMQD